MAKTRHQKFVKSEKSKVKLKKKQELPKGTNVTNTAFKVKKIIIPTQLKSGQAGQPLSKSKLNVKELLSRLQHFNTNMRNDALNGLKELLSTYEEETISSHLGQILLGVSPLVLDREKLVRRESYKVLHMILSPLSLEKIAPFFDVLCSYLRCAMTHIDTRIHEDSLLYFDILLTCAPDLVALNVHKILPSFLDMISKLRVDSKPGRTLMVNLGSQMTSIKWRTKVLLRMLQFLDTLANIKKTSTESEFAAKSMEGVEMNNYEISKYNYNGENFYPLHKKFIIGKLSCFSREQTAASNNQNEGEKLKSYIEVLLPLLFETWLEVRPAGSTDVRRVESVISEEAAMLLKYSLRIFMLLWNLVKIAEKEMRTADMTDWFVNKYKKDFTNYMASSFPYNLGTKQRSKKSKTHLNLTDIIDEKLLEENLVLCHIYIKLNTKPSMQGHQIESSRILNYIEWSFGQISASNTVCQTLVTELLEGILESEEWSKSNAAISLLDKVIAVYSQDDIQIDFKEKLFTILCSILLNDQLLCLQKVNSFQSWLSKLPNVIYDSQQISIESFNIITRFAIQNNGLFNSSIKSKLNLILQNLPKINITGISGDHGTRRKVIGLLYWVKCWDNASLNVLQNQLETNCYDIDSKEFLVDILKLKTEGMFSA